MPDREPPIIRSYQTRRVLLILVGTFILLFVLGLASYSWLRRSRLWTRSAQTAVTAPPGREAPPVERSSAFADLSENTIPGRYKYTDRGQEFFIVLYDDHTFMNRDGTIFRQYRWDIEPDAFTIRWQNSLSRFTVIEKPGVYVVTNGNGNVLRMEKLPPYEPSQLVPPKPIASVVFGTAWETNGLIPLDIGTGILAAGQAGASPCLQVSRSSEQRETSLYLQIAADLKEPPFTNALLLVEFFDAASANGRPDRLFVQYDAAHGVDANAQALPLSAGDTWQEATFFLARPFFQNRQTGGADLHIGTGRSHLFIRSLKLVKNTTLHEQKMPGSVPLPPGK